ncbi:MAG: glycosyltransferase [Gammaproteobacteria bacterium]|nr:glycosyltransferase [Gammaproteobacteria bacterium]
MDLYTDRKMRNISVLFVINTWTLRGAQLQLQRFMRALPCWIDVKVFILNSEGDDSFNAGRSKAGELYFCPSSMQFNVLRAVTLLKFLSKTQHDVVVTLGLGAALFLGRICAVLKGVRVIYSTLHTVQNLNTSGRWYFELFNRMLNFVLPKLPGKRILRFMPNSCKLAHIIGPEAGDYPINTLYNGLLISPSLDICEGKADKVAKDILGPFAEKDFIVQVGALEPEKNHLLALQCMEMLKNDFPDIKLVIVGDGSLREHLARWVESHGLAKTVFFVGNIKQEEVMHIVGTARVFVLTSNTESFPNALAEAQGLGIPAVSFNVGGVPEIVEDGLTGYVVPPGDREEFIRRLTQLVENKSIAQQMGEEARKRIIERFSMGKKVDRFLELVKKDLDVL